MAELKYTKHLLGKIEEVFKEIDYTIRYAKGSFQSGYCLVEQQKIVVVNKFYETEGRINVLIEILDNLNIEEGTLTEKGLKTYNQVRKQKEGGSKEGDEETSEDIENNENTENTGDTENVEEQKEEEKEEPKEESENTEGPKEEILNKQVEVDEL